MLLINAEDIKWLNAANKELLEIQGLVYGAGVGKVNNLTTGPISDAQDEAINKMIEQAKKMEANAIIGVKFDNSTFSGSDISEDEIVVTVYGTAVVIKINTNN
jgi:uncharacterized protein YbjQ (UPF0145 family)